MIKLIDNGEYAKRQLTHFETAYKHTASFLRKYNLADIPIVKIDYAFISDFEFYLKAEICAHNTAMKYLGDFKKVILLCVKRTVTFYMLWVCEV